MPRVRRRAVITGLGLLTPLGQDLDSFWNALRAGTSATRRISYPDASPLPCQLFAEVVPFKPRDLIQHPDPTKAKTFQKQVNNLMARTVVMGLCAGQLAFRQAKLSLTEGIIPERFGVEFGAGMIASELDDLGRAARLSIDPETKRPELKHWGAVGIKEIPPLWMLKYLPNMPSCHVSITLDARGPSNTHTLSDAASLMALGEAYRIIERGACDLFVVGGTESKMNPLSLTRHNLFQMLSKRHREPEKAHRPFDRDRDGSVLGEAAAALILEELDRAQARQATIYAELVGFASGVDRARDGKVMANVIRKALHEAQVEPSQVDHVNAQGLATPFSDRWEAKAIFDVFGDKTPVWCLKGNLGTSGAAAGAVEILGSTLALHHNEVPPTINCDHPDPECRIAVHNQGIKPLQKPYVVKLSFTDMGQTAVAVLKKWE